MQHILIFFICSLINVMLSTMKTVLTVKASKTKATLINALTYGFYAVVVKQLAEYDLIYTVTVTIITNIIGVYVSLLLLEKFSKDHLWKICCTFDNILDLTDCCEALDETDINYSWTQMHSKKESQESFYAEIFSKTQSDSAFIKNLLEGKEVKYNIVEITKNL